MVACRHRADTVLSVRGYCEIAGIHTDGGGGAEFRNRVGSPCKRAPGSATVCIWLPGERVGWRRVGAEWRRSVSTAAAIWCGGGRGEVARSGGEVRLLMDLGGERRRWRTTAAAARGLVTGVIVAARRWRRRGWRGVMERFRTRIIKRSRRRAGPPRVTRPPTSLVRVDGPTGARGRSRVAGWEKKTLPSRRRPTLADQTSRLPSPSLRRSSSRRRRATLTLLNFYIMYGKRTKRPCTPTVLLLRPLYGAGAAPDPRDYTVGRFRRGGGKLEKGWV